jgi:hypothetical protein
VAEWCYVYYVWSHFHGFHSQKKGTEECVVYWIKCAVVGFFSVLGTIMQVGIARLSEYGCRPSDCLGDVIVEDTV